jgi:hypothetical protein
MKTLASELARVFGDIARGEDALETLHGHYCDDKCWHYQMGSEEVKAKIRELMNKRARGSSDKL